jgi:hypothetical protein
MQSSKCTLPTKHLTKNTKYIRGNAFVVFLLVSLVVDDYDTTAVNQTMETVLPRDYAYQSQGVKLNPCGQFEAFLSY